MECRGLFNMTRKRKTRTQLRLPPLSEKVTHPLKKGKRMWRCVMNVLLTMPAPTSAQSVTRIAGSGTTVYQCCMWSQSVQDCVSFVSSSRNSNRTTTRSSLHARSPSMSTRAKTKAQIRAEGTTERAIHRTTRKMKSVIPKKIPPENLSPSQFLMNSKFFKLH